MSKSYYYKVIEAKNCRKHYKRCYQLNKLIDNHLINKLNDFGVVEIFQFSKFHPKSKDSFKINMEGAWQISGVIEDYLLYFTVAKNYDLMISKFEKQLLNWLKSK